MDRGSSRSRSLLWGLLAGLLLGGGGGFLIARLATPSAELAPECPACPISAATIAAAVPPAPVAGPRALATLDGGTGAGEPAIPSASGVRRIDLTISGSLYSTLAGQGTGREADILNAQLGRILMWWMDLRREVLPGDRVQALYEPVEGPGELRLLVVHYTSDKRNQGYQAFFFKRPGAKYGHYYDQAGQEIEQRLANGPIEEYEQITELMNHTGRRHRGVDFKTDVGTPVKAPFRAQVVRTNWQVRGNGNCLELLFAKEGVSALFLHLDQVLSEIKPGVVIEAGTEIARTGNTGHSTAPHLHYELHGPGGRLLNPFQFHQTHRMQLEGEELKAFQAQQAQLERQLQGDGASR